MADLDFSVNADTRSAVNSLRSLESSLGALTSAFGAIGAAISLKGIADFSDSVTSLRNRLIQLTGSQSEAADQFNGLAAIAIRSRSGLDGIGDLYYRIAKSSKDLGISQADAAQVTETVAKALSMSGVSAAEARGPLLQLGQALQSGRVQGDELRSIMEGLGPVAKILADSLGVPVGALKTLGAAGQISAEQLVQALLKAKNVIDNDFAKTIPTISSAFQELKTVSAIAFNNFETNTKTAESLASAIQGLGYVLYSITKNIDDFIDRWGGVIVTIGKVVLAFASFTIVGGLVRGILGAFSAVATAFASLSGAGAAIFEIGATAAAAGGGFTGWAGAIAYVITNLTRLIAPITAAIGAVLAFTGLGDVVDWFKKLGDSNSDARKEIQSNREEYDKFLASFKTDKGPAAPGFVDPKFLQQLDQQVLNYKRGNDELRRKLNLEKELIGINDKDKTARQAQFDAESTYISEINKLTDDYRVKAASKNKDDQAALPAIQKRIAQVTEEFDRQRTSVQALTVDSYNLKQAEQLRLNLQDLSAKTVFDGDKKIRDLRDNMAKSTMPELERKIYDIKRASDEVALSEIERENSSRRRLGLNLLTATEEQQFFEKTKARNADLARTTEEDYARSRQWSTGWSQAFNSYVESATNAAEQAKNIFQKATQGMEDLIVNFAKTGKFEFKNFLSSLAEELLRSQVKQLMANLFTTNNAGSTGGGSISSFIGSLLGFASGGIIPTNGPVIVGERGPEILSGAAGRSVTPNGQFGGSVTYNINAVDAMSFKQMVARDPSFIHAIAMQGAKGTPGRY